MPRCMADLGEETSRVHARTRLYVQASTDHSTASGTLSYRGELTRRESDALEGRGQILHVSLVGEFVTYGDMKSPGRPIAGGTQREHGSFCLNGPLKRILWACGGD